MIVVLTINNTNISRGTARLPARRERGSGESYLSNVSCNFASRSGKVLQNPIQTFPSPFLLVPKHHSYIAPLLSESFPLIPVLPRKARGALGTTCWTGGADPH